MYMGHNGTFVILNFLLFLLSPNMSPFSSLLFHNQYHYLFFSFHEEENLYAKEANPLEEFKLQHLRESLL